MLQFRATIFKYSGGRLFLILPLLFFLLISCRGGEYDSAGFDNPEEGEFYPSAVVAEADFSEPALLKTNQMPYESSSRVSPLPAERIRTYHAGCSIRVADPDKTMSELSRIIEKHEGFVESISGRTAVLRVPADNLDKALSEIISAGELISKYIETSDVTDQYLDLDGRIKLLEKSRQRMALLLKSENDIEKKVRILKELKRIDDELERLKISMNNLEKEINIPTITVNLELYDEGDASGGIPFSWIDNLDPFNSSVNLVMRQVSIDLPSDFAVIKSKKYFHAESSDGTIVRISSVRNNPEGDSEFWQKALVYYQKRFYKKYEKFDLNSVKGILFTSRDDYRYFTAAFIRKPLLYIIEVFYPGEESLNKYSDDINKALEEFKVK